MRSLNPTRARLGLLFSRGTRGEDDGGAGFDIGGGEGEVIGSRVTGGEDGAGEGCGDGDVGGGGVGGGEQTAGHFAVQIA